jgi:hypothetical protein
MLRASIRMSSNFSFRSTAYKFGFEPIAFFTAHRSRVDEQAVCWSYTIGAISMLFGYCTMNN